MTNISRHSRHENLKNCNFSITVEIMSSPTEGIHLYNTANWSFSNWTLKTFFITQVTNIKICHMEQWCWKEDLQQVYTHLPSNCVQVSATCSHSKEVGQSNCAQSILMAGLGQVGDMLSYPRRPTLKWNLTVHLWNAMHHSWHTVTTWLGDHFTCS